MPDFKRSQMKSTITTGDAVRAFAPAQSNSTRLQATKAAGDAVKAAKTQQVKAATSDLVMAGTGDVDNRKMLTPALGDMQAVTRVTGSGQVGSFAHSTTKDKGQEYQPDFFDGLFAPFGYYAVPEEITPNPNLTVKGLTPTSSNRSRAGNISGTVIQKPSVW